MLACLALTVLVSLPDLNTNRVHHEWHHATFCEPATYLPDQALPMERLTRCENAAQWYIEGMQHAGILPGSVHVISYRVTCDNHI